MRVMLVLCAYYGILSPVQFRSSRWLNADAAIGPRIYLLLSQIWEYRLIARSAVYGCDES